MSASPLSELPMIELFRAEVEAQAREMTAGLLRLESEPARSDQLQVCMRAAHSLKGAARIVGLEAGVRVAHAMEDGFVGAQQGRFRFSRASIDVMLRGVDLLLRLSQLEEGDVARWSREREGEISEYASAVAALGSAGVSPSSSDAVRTGTQSPAPSEKPLSNLTLPATEPVDRVLRVTADNLNRLLGLAGESMVESRWLKPFSAALLRLKRQQAEFGRSVEGLQAALADGAPPEKVQRELVMLRQRSLDCQQQLAQRLSEIELFDRRSANLAHRLYDEALAVRMRPFGDALTAFPRMVRDVAQELGREVKFELIGETTQVDRDMLERLEAPLGHLLRNAIDHGIEKPAARASAGKPTEGVIRLEARHFGGLLQISVSDDGAGVDLEKLRMRVVERGLTQAETAARLSDAELLEFLFLPGFTLRETVTAISGRGVGLDVVHTMVRDVRGTVRVLTHQGRGTRFQLQLPLTLSVVRTLLVEIAGEPYAFPLAAIGRTLKLSRADVATLEGRQHFVLEDRAISLLTAHQVLGRGELAAQGEEYSVVVVSNGGSTYGLVVDRFLGERELVVQPLDARLGKVRDIAAGALMEDGSPVLIIDVDDLLRSVEKRLAAGRLVGLSGVAAPSKARRKRVLVVDDSLTVRELERKLLGGAGYEVVAAVDGMDGWNSVRGEPFDLVVTDVDMPRMDGIELVGCIKRDPILRALPVMIVSYKDREEDRRRGLDAGADYYLTKGSFHDATLIQAVVDLIGEAGET